MDEPVNSFFRFVAGFFTFISVSFGVTYLAQSMIVARAQAENTAAAARAMLEKN